jgi:hypothetical protein
MSSITFRYEQNYSFVKKGIKHTIKESVIDGTKGITIMFLEKKGDEFYKMYVKEIEKDKFEIIEKKGEDEQPKETISEKELIKLLKKYKLDTIINYLSNERGTYKGKQVSKKVIKLAGY